MRPFLLCIFVPLPTSVIMIVHSSSFNWTLSLFILYFLDVLRSLFTQAHPLEPELPSAINYFLKYDSHQLKKILHQWIWIEYMDLNSNL